jgi:predicted kinase
MRNRSRGRGKRRGKAPERAPRPRSQSTPRGQQPQLPPLQPFYPGLLDETGSASAPEAHEHEPVHAEERPERDAEPVAAEEAVAGGANRKRRRGRRGRRGSGKGADTRRQSQAAAEPVAAAELEEAAPLADVEPEPAESRAAPAFAPELQKQPEKKPRGVVVLTVGLPGSGKSTWFKRRGVTPLSSDTLRNILFDDITEQRYQHLVFSTLRSLLRARLIARMPWNYVDATNLNPKERRAWIHMARGFGYEVHAVFFDVPVEVCTERNRRRERMVPEDVMQRMAAKLVPPSFEEGFAKITVVRVKPSPQMA